MKMRFLYKKINVALFCIIFVLCVPIAKASPKQVIIIRHAEQLIQSCHAGHFLAPQGIMRSLAFAHYYLNKFHSPDYIIATNPMGPKKLSSMRELQTIAPLANELAARHPTIGVNIVANYHDKEEKQLTRDLLSKKTYADKIILICWHHAKIPELLTGLGVDVAHIRFDENSYDTVYVVDYDKNGTAQLDVLYQQYPVSFDGTWGQLYDKML